jgi:3-oxoacyl-[acyl-carrier-protein] synthase II
MLAGCLSMEFRATGQSMVVATACASGATAAGMAFDLLNADRCDVVLTGGSEAMITPLMMTGFARLGALSRRTKAPHEASRPFDADRDGFVAGEGATILVLERTQDARARGARVRARLLGYGTTADAYHVTTPDPAGSALERALRSALADAGAVPADVDHVNAHATGTPQGDRTEARVLRRVFGDGPVVTSTKGVTGHMFGAAGAAEGGFTVLTIEHGLIPPTANLCHPDPDIQLKLAAKPVEQPVTMAVSCSSGFGGHNTVLLIGAP